MRGLEIFGSIGVTAPITPTCTDPLSNTVLPAMRPRSTSACSSGSAEKSRLADRNGIAGSKPVMNRAVTSGPMSKSWLPRAIASYTPLRAIESYSGPSRASETPNSWEARKLSPEVSVTTPSPDAPDCSCFMSATKRATPGSEPSSGRSFDSPSLLCRMVRTKASPSSVSWAPTETGTETRIPTSIASTPKNANGLLRRQLIILTPLLFLPAGLGATGHGTQNRDWDIEILVNPTCRTPSEPEIR